MQAILKNLDLIGGLLAALAILTGTVFIDAPLWLSIMVGGALFMGCRLISSHWMELSVAREAANLNQALMQQKISMGLEKVRLIRKHAASITDKETHDQVVRICDIADRIFHNFEQDPGDKFRASRFLLYLNRFLPLIETFARLSATKEGRDMLEQTQDGQDFRNMLNTVEEGFTKGFQNYLENDVVELRTFGRVLTRMMDVAEIGK